MERDPREREQYLTEQFEELIARTVPDASAPSRLSERDLLLTWLTPYLGEYPELASDAELVQELRHLLGEQPMLASEDVLSRETFDSEWKAIERSRDRQIRALLERRLR
jgi:hypothetical protein